MDFSGLGPGRFHLEASGRTGGVHNEFESLDLRNSLGRHAQFDSYATYYGFHMGAGYEWDLSDMASLELYGKYYWALLDRNSSTLSTGESVFFDYARSSRLRFGGRVAFAVSDRLRPYFGVAWEHEFSGKAEATINGNEIDAPSLRGHTGIGELGLSFKPLETTPLNVDLGLKGYAGKREGLAGSLRVKMEF